MKKLFGTAMLAALLASSAFAELNIGGGALQLWSPVAYNGGDVMTGSQCPWGGGRTASIGFNWVSEDEKAGSAFTFVYDPWGGIGPDGNRIIWVKPWDFLKLTIGHWDGINDITVVNTASWDWIRPSTWLNGDSHLYSENEATGALIEVTPVENLIIRAGLPFANADLSYHMFEALAADVEYTITDILGIKVGWRGGRFGDGHRDNFDVTSFKYDDKFMNVGEVDVYASLLAVENLQLEVGARINILNADYADATSIDFDNAVKEAKKNDPNYDPTDYERGEGVGRPSALIGLRAGYNITDNFSIKADFGVVTYKKAEIASVTGKHKPDFTFGVGVGVGLTDSLSLVADFRGLIKGDVEFDDEKYSADPTFSFLVGLNYACSSNASVGIGFQGKTNGGVFGPLSERKDYTGFGFAVPIRVDVHF